MRKIAINLFLLLCLSLTGLAQPSGSNYDEIQNRLQQGWNTWDSRSVTSWVLLPQQFAVNLGFKQVQAFDEPFLDRALIGRRGEDAEQVRPGPHTFEGSYSELSLQWKNLHADIQTAHLGEDLVILISPKQAQSQPVRLVVSSALLWNASGSLQREQDHLQAQIVETEIKVFTTAEPVNDPYVPCQTPYLAIDLEGPVGISTGKRRSLEEIQQAVSQKKQELDRQAAQYGELADAWQAIQAGIAWNTIYEPKFDRVVSTVGRLWNEEYGGYCLFGWDNFFLSYMTSLYSRELAFANVIEHLKGMTEEGFIPNDNSGNGRKTWDHSQPPVGAIMVKEIYKQYPEQWFLEAVFDDLLEWNRWWVKKRMNEGLLAYGSHKARNPFGEWARQNMQAARYESGMDDSPMYLEVPFNKEKNTMELQDVGLNGLYIADCQALAEMAKILERKAEYKELTNRTNELTGKLKKLWNKERGIYLNYRTDLQDWSYRLSPTLFYPMLTDMVSKKQAKRMVEEHFFNPEEFAGEWMMPSIARNDVMFNKQRYWKGAIWPPLNFLAYLGLRNCGQQKACRELSEKSLKLLVTEWKRKGFVSENYSSITGTGDDQRLSSDRFHSWGALFGIISFIEAGHMPGTETPIQ